MVKIRPPKMAEIQSSEKIHSIIIKAEQGLSLSSASY